MTVSISRMNIEYYLSTTMQGDGALKEVRDLTSYYVESGAPPGRWLGAGLDSLGLESGQTVKKRHARKLFEELRDPITGVALGRRPMATQETPEGAKTPMGKLARDKREAVAGFDLTFSVPKSVSVLWALADTPTQGKVYAAHQAALAQTVAWLEANIVQTRSGHGGVAHQAVTGLIGTAFDHWESRAGDPQLHTHLVVANRVQRVEDGQWATLDSYTLHRYVVAASEMYNGLLYDEVARRTGAVAEQRGGQVVMAIHDAANPVTEDEGRPDTARVELAGIPDELIHEFSSRARAIAEEKDRLIAEFIERNGYEPTSDQILKLRQQATLSTRTAKDKTPHSLRHRMTGWRVRTVENGFDPAQVVSEALDGDPHLLSYADLPDAVTERISAFVLEQVSRSRASFNKANLLAATHRLLATVRCADPGVRHELVNGIVTQTLAGAVKLSPTRMGLPAHAQEGLTRNGHSVFDTPETWLYATQTTLDTEALLQAAATTKTGPAMAATDELAELLSTTEVGDGHTLAADQAMAAHHALTDDRLVSAIIGPAGTGKTTTMRGIHTAWTGAHGPSSVVGLAPSAVAASVLGQEVGMDTDNVAKWLHESIGPGAATRAARYADLETTLATLTTALAADPTNPRLRNRLTATQTRLTEVMALQAHYTLKQGQLLIVDEASMASTSDLAALTDQAEAAGAKVLLVGDPAQLEAVDAGGFLGWMERAGHAATLSSVWRFKNDWEAQASLALRQGDTDVITTYAENGRLTSCAEGTATENAYRAWLDTTTSENPPSAILIGADNADVFDLNQRAQADLVAAGRVDPDNGQVRLRADAHAHIGDLLLARKNNRQITDGRGDFIKNGSRLSVSAIHPDGSVTATREETGASVHLPADYLAESVELGYAVTAHRAQGVTVDKAYAVARQGLGRELLYVAMTRGKELNQLYVEPPEEEDHSVDPWGIYKKQTVSSARAVLTGILDNSNAVRLASEARADEYGKAHDLTRYVSEYEHLATVVSTRELSTWVNETYGPSTLRDLQRNPEWSTMVKNWASDTPPPMAEDAAAEQIAAQLARPQTTGRKLHERLIPRVNPGTEEETRVAALLETRISEQIDRLMPTEPGDGTGWWEGDTAPAHSTRAEVLYRALTGQDAPAKPTAPPGAGSRRLRPLWNRLTELKVRSEITAAWDEHADNAYQPAVDLDSLHLSFGRDFPDLWDEHGDYTFRLADDQPPVTDSSKAKNLDDGAAIG